MTEVRFYQLSRDPVERVVPLLAAKLLDAGERLVVVSGSDEQRAALSEALWRRENTFLAHGSAEEPHAARQPALLADTCEAANGARNLLLADGVWREEAAHFERVVLLFAAGQTGEARQLWSALGAQGHALRIFKQGEDGSWREGR